MKRDLRRKGETHLTASEKETFRLAEKIGQILKGQEIILLFGELGAGKTVFAKGIAFGLGLKDLAEVSSPSYTLIHFHRARHPIVHLDLYRLSDPAEIDDLGWKDHIGEGVVIVEWAEKLHWHGQAIRVYIDFGKDDERRIQIIPPLLTRRQDASGPGRPA